MIRSMLKIIGALAFTLSLTLGAISVSGANLAFAANEPAPATNLYAPVASTPSGVETCLPNGLNLRGFPCGGGVLAYPYYGYGYYNGGYASPVYTGNVEPQYCAPDGDSDFDDTSCNGSYGGYYSPAYNPNVVYSPYYYSPNYYAPNYNSINPYQNHLKLVRVGNRWYWVVR